MPRVQFKALMAAVHQVALRRGAGFNLPTTLVQANATLFHAFDQRYFAVDPARRIFRRDEAMLSIKIFPSAQDSNRFTGSSMDLPGIEPCGGLYCSLQQQAIVNEVAHYVNADAVEEATKRGVAPPKPAPRTEVMGTKPVVKIQAMAPVLAVEFSPHNPNGMGFVNSLGEDKGVQDAMKAAGKGRASVWDAMNDGVDCSVARGLGLAVAKMGYKALCVQTVRTSERSSLETGDNIVFLGREGQMVPDLWVVEAYYFPQGGGIERYPVEY
jgi:hypothetical protein